MIDEIANYINGEDYPDEIPKMIMRLFEREHADLLVEVKRLQRKIVYVKELTLSMPVGFKRIDSISASIIEAICTKEEYIALGFPVSSNLEYRGDD